MLNNIVDNIGQCGQQNIVHCCFHQARTVCSFFAVYRRKKRQMGNVKEYVKKLSEGNNIGVNSRALATPPPPTQKNFQMV